MKTTTQASQDLFRGNMLSFNYLNREEEFYRTRVEEAWGGNHIMHGLVPGEKSVCLMSNDYLALANNSEILTAQADAILNKGNGLLMSGVFLHGDNPQSEFERRMAALMLYERTVLSQSGWCANVGLMQTIADETTPVYLDMNSHMSLWEGARIAGAEARAFLHNDIDHLAKQIDRYGPGVIAVDSVYSLDGSVCPLERLVEVGERYGCVIVVDESHSLATHGEIGQGMVASLGLSGRVHFVTASLAKGFAARAGLIACSHSFYDYFKSNSYPAIFSSTLLLHEVVALQKTLDVVMKSGRRREQLRANSEFLRARLSDLGYQVNASESQIIALEAGPEWRTLQLRDALESRDVFGSIFCAPATSKNRSLVRFSLNSDLTITELEHVVDVCAEIVSEVGLADWPINRRQVIRSCN